MIIKNHKNKNQYVLAENDIWVRDFTKKTSPISINNIDSKDQDVLLSNELENRKNNYPDAESQIKSHNNIIIISDGWGFEEKHKIISKLPKEIQIFSVNKSLSKWKLEDRLISLYFVNNPYSECEMFLPKNKHYPKCITSLRSNPNFLNKYRGFKYGYTPIRDQNYSGWGHQYQIKLDDYRNPVCAAISFAYLCNVRKLMLLCCDDSFDKERPGSILENGMWCYEQQLKSQKIIDANLYWLKQQEVQVANHSTGLKMKNADYIELEDIVNFFDETI